MSLLSMAVYCTEENGKDECLDKTLSSLLQTVEFDKHRIVFSVNAGTDHTREILNDFGMFMREDAPLEIIYNGENLGTAGAINKVWALRSPGENVVKLDDDVVFHQAGWVDKMEDAIKRDPSIGIIGLKRNDLMQSPWQPDPHFRSEVKMLPHEHGQQWIVVEKADDIIGTCTMFNSLLLDKVGFSRQPGKYGFEDSLFCHRSHLAGFYNCFLSNYDIDHIDNRPTPYIDWKRKHSEENFKEYHRLVHAMIAGIEPTYYNPFQS